MKKVASVRFGSVSKELLIVIAAIFGLAGAVNDGISGYFFAIPFYIFLSIVVALPPFKLKQRIFSVIILVVSYFFIKTQSTSHLLYSELGKTVTSTSSFEVIRYDAPFVIGDNSVFTFEDKILRDLLTPRPRMEPFPKPTHRETVPVGLKFEAFKILLSGGAESAPKVYIYFRNDKLAFRVEHKSLAEFRQHVTNSDWLTAEALCERPVFGYLSNLMYYPMSFNPFIFVGRHCAATSRD